MFVRLEIWSVVLLSFRNPFCSSERISFVSVHFINLLFRKPLNSLKEAGARAIPLYDIESLLSKVDDCGTGLRTNLDHSLCTFPV